MLLQKSISIHAGIGCINSFQSKNGALGICVTPAEIIHSPLEFSIRVCFRKPLLKVGTQPTGELQGRTVASEIIYLSREDTRMDGSLLDHVKSGNVEEIKGLLQGTN